MDALLKGLRTTVVSGVLSMVLSDEQPTTPTQTVFGVIALSGGV